MVERGELMPFHGRKRKVVNAEKEDSDEEDVILTTYKESLFYRGTIQQPEATQFCIALRKLADAYHDTRDHIVVHLTTEGGDLFAGISMYEAIRRSSIPVHIIAEGNVCSAGTIVMMGAKKRYMYNTSVVLVHALSSWMMGHCKPKEIQEELQNCETLLEIMTEIYRRHTRLTKAQLKQMYNTDLYMRAEDCMKRGFIDEVLY